MAKPSNQPTQSPAETQKSLASKTFKETKESQKPKTPKTPPKSPPKTGKNPIKSLEEKKKWENRWRKKSPTVIDPKANVAFKPNTPSVKNTTAIAQKEKEPVPKAAIALKEQAPKAAVTQKEKEPAPKAAAAVAKQTQPKTASSFSSKPLTSSFSSGVKPAAKSPAVKQPQAAGKP